MNNNYDRVLKEMFLRPTYKFHIRELARVTKLNPNTISNIVRRLEKEGVIKREAKKHIVEVSLRLEDKKTLWKKRLFNLSQIYDSGLVDFLIEKYSPSSVSLVGSYSRGEDLEKSDIDIVVITNRKEVVDLSRIEKSLNRKVHLILARFSELSEEFFTNLINGIVLYGAIRK